MKEHDYWSERALPGSDSSHMVVPEDIKGCYSKFTLWGLLGPFFFFFLIF